MFYSKSPRFLVIQLLILGCLLLGCDGGFLFNATLNQTTTLYRDGSWTINMEIVADENDVKLNIGEREMELGIERALLQVEATGATVNWHSRVRNGEIIYEVEIADDHYGSISMLNPFDTVRADTIDGEVQISYQVSPQGGFQSEIYTLNVQDVLETNGTEIDSGVIRWINPSSAMQATVTGKRPAIMGGRFNLGLLGLIIFVMVGAWAYRRWQAQNVNASSLILLFSLSLLGCGSESPPIAPELANTVVAPTFTTEVEATEIAESTESAEPAERAETPLNFEGAWEATVDGVPWILTFTDEGQYASVRGSGYEVIERGEGTYEIQRRRLVLHPALLDETEIFAFELDGEHTLQLTRQSTQEQTTFQRATLNFTIRFQSDDMRCLFGGTVDIEADIVADYGSATILNENGCLYELQGYGGAYTISAEAEDHFPLETTILVSENNQVIDIDMESFPRFHVSVVDPQGDPIDCWRSEPQFKVVNLTTQEETTVTEFCRFAIQDEFGLYEVSAELAKYQPNVQKINFTQSDQEVVLTLEPIPSLNVQLEFSNTPCWQFAGTITIRNQATQEELVLNEGPCELAIETGYGTYEIEAEVPGYQTIGKVVEFTSFGQNVLLQFMPTPTFEVQIIQPNGEPINCWQFVGTISVLDETTGTHTKFEDACATVVTGELGRYIISVDVPKYQQIEHPVEFSQDGQIETVQLEPIPLSVDDVGQMALLSNGYTGLILNIESKEIIADGIQGRFVGIDSNNPARYVVGGCLGWGGCHPYENYALYGFDGTAFPSPTFHEAGFESIHQFHFTPNRERVIFAIDQDYWRADVEWSSFTLHNPTQLTNLALFNAFGSEFFVNDDLFLVTTSVGTLGINIDSAEILEFSFDLPQEQILSPDKKIGFVSAWQVLYVYDYEAFTVGEIALSDVRHITWLSNDTALVYYGGWSSSAAALYDRKTQQIGEPFATFTGDDIWVLNQIVSISPKGEYIVSHHNQTTWIINTKTASHSVINGSIYPVWVNDDAFFFSRDSQQGGISLSERGTWRYDISSDSAEQISQIPYGSATFLPSLDTVLFVAGSELWRVQTDGSLLEQVEVVSDDATMTFESYSIYPITLFE